MTTPAGSGTPAPPNVAELLTTLTGNITSVVEDRLSRFKRELSEENSVAIESAAKKARGDGYEFRKPGNKQQFKHEEQVLGKLQTALAATNSNARDKAKAALNEGIELILHRMKLIKLADKSEFGWGTVNEYVSDELASNSDDEKRMERSEKRAEKKVKLKKRSRRSTRPFNYLQSQFGPSTGNQQQQSAFHQLPLDGQRGTTSKFRTGPCFRCGQWGHLQNRCTSFASQPVPTQPRQAITSAPSQAV